MKQNKKSINPKLKELVETRIKAMSPDIELSVGSENLSREKLLGHVNDEDEIGKQIIEMQLEFLQDLGSGAIYGNE
jgi:hypothetical protein